MTYDTLMTEVNHIKKQVAKTLSASPFSPVLKEIGLFAGIFISVFVISIVFVNANLFYHAVKGVFTEVQAENYVFTSNNVSTMMQDSNELDSFMAQNEKDAALQAIKKDHTLFVSSKEKVESTLKNTNYPFSYSLIPPGNRLFIPAIGVDAPIVDISAASEAKLKHGDFNQELYSGVVKYPSTPEPWSKGNTLIFGHTSFYRWKNNPYWEIFSKIYNLKKGDEIKIAWKWQLYTYEIIETVITTPSKVDETYMQYIDGEYLTLMGCYPVWSDSKRWLIIAKRKWSPSGQTNNWTTNTITNTVTK